MSLAPHKRLDLTSSTDIARPKTALIARYMNIVHSIEDSFLENHTDHISMSDADRLRFTRISLESRSTYAQTFCSPVVPEEGARNATASAPSLPTSMRSLAGGNFAPSSITSWRLRYGFEKQVLSGTSIMIRCSREKSNVGRAFSTTWRHS